MRRLFSLSAFAAICLVFVGLPAASAQTQKRTLKFSASVVMPFSNTENTGFEDRILKELFGRLGYDLKVHFVPAERALLNLSEGLDDGALGRVQGVVKAFPNIVEIPEEAFVRDFVVFARDTDFVPVSWGSLAPYNVGYINGWKIVERNVKETKSVALASNDEQLFRMLSLGRIDVAIYNRWGGLQLVKDMGLPDVRLLEPPLASAPHYFVLNAKHAGLAEPAAAALREMKADGTYLRIFEETLAPLTRQ